MPPTTPDWLTLIGQASQPVIFAALFIYLFVQTRQEARDNRVADKAEAKEREEWFRKANVEHATAMRDVTAELRAVRQEITARLDRIERGQEARHERP